jgi:hypothetical protein
MKNFLRVVIDTVVLQTRKGVGMTLVYSLPGKNGKRAERVMRTRWFLLTMMITMRMMKSEELMMRRKRSI